MTEDSVTLRWNASTDNSGSILRYQVTGVYHPAPARRRRSPAWCPTGPWPPRVRGRPDREPVRASRPADGDDGAGRDRAHDARGPAADSDERRRASRWPGPLDRPLVGQLRGVDGRSVVATRPRPPRGSARSRSAKHTFTVRARDTGGNFSGVSNAISVNLADTGDRTPPDRAVEPDRRQPRGLLRQRALELDAVDRQRRRATRSSTSSTATGCSSTSGAAPATRSSTRGRG